MMELGMAGEVRLAPQAAECQNFKDWGIEILVKFREKAKLQVLSAQVHSGGERSVSTIMYLMALQELMTAPFRCVDEINQGLDERNERLVFKRIVMDSTRQEEDWNVDRFLSKKRAAGDCAGCRGWRWARGGMFCELPNREM